jgi:hypothetical protein
MEKANCPAVYRRAGQQADDFYLFLYITFSQAFRLSP